MMTSRCSPIRLALFAVAVLTAGTGTSALAESACKGLEQPACESKAGCHWVDGYTRKDGIKVSGHCRSSSKKKGAAEKETASKKDAAVDRKSTPDRKSLPDKKPAPEKPKATPSAKME